MTLLGTLLKNRRGRDIHSAWNRPNLHGPELLIVTSEDFGEGQSIPQEHAGKRVGGNNLSPDLSWSPSPPETTSTTPDAARIDRVRPRTLLNSLSAPVIARGRLTGDYER